jgi:hypothetical protein
MYETGSKHNIFAGEEMLEAVVLYNNGKVAVLGIATSLDITYDEFLMPADDIKSGIREFDLNVTLQSYNAFAVIAQSCGCLLARREWLRKNDALFVIGKEYEFPEEYAEFRIYLGSITTVYKNRDIAILRINGGEGFVLDAFRTCGYNKMEIVSQISDFTDDVTPTSDEPLYFCIRICDDAPIDLKENSIREKLDNLLNEEFTASRGDTRNL